MTNFPAFKPLCLLAFKDSVHGVHFVHYDGNGNVSALVNAADGTISAEYEYGPFGEPLRAETVVAKANPIRFSTKYRDEQTDWFNYPFRFYATHTGRWASRDPIEEEGGENLYAFVYNGPAHAVDPSGDAPYDTRRQNEPQLEYVPPVPGGRVIFGPNLPPAIDPDLREPIRYNGRVIRVGRPVAEKVGRPTRGIADLLKDAGNRLNEGISKSKVQNGVKDCEKQRRRGSSCPGCCVIRIYAVQGAVTGTLTYHGGNAELIDISCAKLKAMSKSNGALIPYYGNMSRGGLLKDFFAKLGLRPLVPISDQTDASVYIPW